MSKRHNPESKMPNPKAKCLTYPGQPDNVTTAELIKYFKDLDAKAIAAQKLARRFP